MTVLADAKRGTLGEPSYSTATGHIAPSTLITVRNRLSEVSTEPASGHIDPSTLETVRDRLSEPLRRPLCDDDLTDDDLISFRWISASGHLINRLYAQLDWDPDTAQFTKAVLYEDVTSIRRYGPRPPVMLAAHGLETGEGVVAPGDAFLLERATELFQRFSLVPATVLQVEVFYRRGIVWDVGDIICVTSQVIPDPFIGGRGLVDRPFEIVDLRPTFGPQGKVTATLVEVLDPLFLPEPPIFLPPVIVLEGSVTAMASVSATLTGGTPVLTASVAATATVAGALTVPAPLAASIAASASATGVLTVPKPLAGSIGASASVTGGLTIPKPLTASIVATATATGALTTSIRFAATVTATATTSATLTLPIALAATVTATASVSADLTPGAAAAGPYTQLVGTLGPGRRYGSFDRA
jgi:hypothetical protein